MDLLYRTSGWQLSYVQLLDTLQDPFMEIASKLPS